MSHEEDAEHLLRLAQRARYHAKLLTDAAAVKALCAYAGELEQKVSTLKEERQAKSISAISDGAAGIPSDTSAADKDTPATSLPSETKDKSGSPKPG